MTAAGRRFVFAPLERRGLLLGLTPMQLMSIAAGVLLAVVAVNISPDAFGIGGGLGLALAGVAGACLPVGGRPPVQWLPIATGWAARRRRGPVLDGAPRLGESVRLRRPAFTASLTDSLSSNPLTRGREGRLGRDRRSAAPQRRRAISAVAKLDALGTGVEIVALAAPPGQTELGVVRDPMHGTWVAALPVRGRAFALLDPVDKERRLASWGSLLAGLARAGSPVHRLQWVERSFAGDGDALGRYLDVAAPPPPPGEATLATPQGAARAAYVELIAEAGPATLAHESLLVLAIQPRRASRALRPFGRGDDAVAGLLRRELRLLQGQVRNAELSASDPLDAAGMTLALRAAVDPGVRRRPSPSPLARTGAWALATDEGWGSMRADATWYATFWIAEWPRVEVGPDFLAPLLLAGEHRTVSVTMAPVPPERARRQVEAARTAEAADEELRRRAGFLPTARRRREADGVAQREAELADGHAEFRFSGYVTVSGVDSSALEAACAEVEQVAQQSRLELRRLYGQQREAFAWTLPLTRGLA